MSGVDKVGDAGRLVGGQRIVGRVGPVSDHVSVVKGVWDEDHLVASISGSQWNTDSYTMRIREASSIVDSRVGLSGGLEEGVVNYEKIRRPSGGTRNSEEVDVITSLCHDGIITAS